LQTVYSLEDLHALMEIVVVDRHNEWIAARPQGD
jgi:hypothetical protein